ncbi:endonuclease domain-containing protein [Azospira restricta]|uniref:Endonuclease domain-containing protein n=1 Tax=Azospira restricta TaxID=404405 RepID=A0A974PV59_9RHOO|nr:endonuclease domain-containing protein [Azospira restricta]QRJ62129.1 endonuclease domain-containing protein [Azospira restricta]
MKGQTSHSILDEQRQKSLRKNMTDAENRLWQRLRGRQIASCKFRRQHPFLDYVLDFVCLERRLVIEVDGGQHLESERDAGRDRRIENAGFRVLRFWNNQVLQEIEAVVEAIHLALTKEPHPHPSPPLEGEGEEPFHAVDTGLPSPFKGEAGRGMGANNNQEKEPC